MKSLIRLILLLAPLSAVAQSSLPPCPTNPNINWHNCFGTYTFPNGNQYVGEWRDNNRNGLGTFTWADGSKYVGQFQRGNFHGLGTMTWSNGNSYVGEHQSDKRNGRGTFTWADGEKYVGEFRNDSRHGQGIFYAADGTIKHSGEWADGNLSRSFAIDTSRFPFDGQASARVTLPPCPNTGRKHNCTGSVTYSDSRYEGEFQNDARHGRGTYTWASGERYVGEFRDDKTNGRGTRTWPNGRIYVGEERDDRKHGQGTFTWPNGEKYVGEWRDDQRHGLGIHYRSNGTVGRSGRWADGQLAESFALDTSRFPFDSPSQVASSPADPGRAERDRLAAEAEAAKRRQRELEAQLEAERKKRAEAESRRGGSQASSNGTGFSVAPGIIVTNQHVVAGCQRLEVLSTDGRRSALVMDSDELVDLALLRVTGLGGGVAPIRRVGSVRLGEQAYSFGFPLTGLLSESGNFTGGTVSSLRGLRDSANQIQISTPLQPGNSGGALADASGSVIGVVVSKLDASAIARATGDIPQNVNFAVSLQALFGFLGRNNVPVRTVDRGTALDTAQLADVMRSFTHRIECFGQSAASDRSSPRGPTAAPSENDTTVVLKNESRQTILKIFVSPESSRTWGPDLLGTGILSAGRTFTLKPPAAQGCIFDVRVEYSGGRSEQKQRQDFCSLVELVFSGN